MHTIRQHLRVLVNAASIRVEDYQGRPHVVIPSYTLPDDVVMNGGLYTRSEVDAHYKELENTFAPLGHPIVNGEHVSAASPEGINGYHIGAFNRNVERRGNRIHMEKWVDTTIAVNSEKGRRLLDALNFDASTGQLTGVPTEPIHTSVAAFALRELCPNAAGYQWKARIQKFDHDAILLDEPGAATPEQGVGLMVNVADAKPLQVGDSVLSKNSYSARNNALSTAATLRYGEYAWIQDFDDATAVISFEGETRAVGYTIDADGVVTFAAESADVVRETSWVVNQVHKFLQSLGVNIHSAGNPIIPNKSTSEADTMTPEEMKALLDTQRTALEANFSQQIAPLTERLTALETNQAAITDSFTAAAKTEEAAKRTAVAAKLGEVVANALSGEALDAAFKQVQGTAPIVNSGAPAGGNDEKFDVAPD